MGEGRSAERNDLMRSIIELRKIKEHFTFPYGVGATSVALISGG
jgi:hypothetical protein